MAFKKKNCYEYANYGYQPLHAVGLSSIKLNKDTHGTAFRMPIL